MKKLYVLLLLAFCTAVKGQLLVTTPDFPKETDANIIITMDATKGNQGLLNYNPADVYVHIGAITNFSTSSSDWKYVPFTNFSTPYPAAKAVSLGNNKWSYTLTGASVRAYFGITNASEHILKIAILFRNGAGSTVQRNANGSDMYLPLYEAGLYVKITQPAKQPTFIPVPEPITKTVGDVINLEAKSSQAANLKLFYNGTQVASLNGTTITAAPTITLGGSQRIIAEAESAGAFRRDTIDFFVNSPTEIAPLPAGVVDGINYNANNTSATLVLFAPQKNRIIVLGDFNNWLPAVAYQMKKTPDGNRFWLELTGLTPGTEYAYQYLIDDVLKVADYNAEKVLDPNNDQFITAATYPNLKPYPTGLTTGIVSVLQTAKPQYTWSSGTFTRPDKRNLVVYELLVRDFVEKHDYKTLIDSLGYLKRLGINAIHVMPFNEFEGNSSWGYNPSFFLAPDKYYGNENELRRFVDSAHKNGMAVIMDLVLNHAFGQSPMVQMYFNGAANRPAANSPWFNQTAPHTWLEFGYDFNHEAQATKDFTDQVITHWLTKYRIDGIRWDFTKGFSQRAAPTEAASAAYDASRIAILNRINNKMQAIAPGSYCILEHFAANNEEIELSNNGMMLWGNTNRNFNEASMGYIGNSNFQYGIHTNRGWANPLLLTYAESHDEERLMYKNEQFGNSSGSYNVKNIPTGLKRQEMVAAFLLTIPGPKMIWQWGELGYDYSINRCPDGTISDNCRTDPKPAAWNYLADANRKQLYNVYGHLNRLKTNPAYFSTFTTNDITYDLGSGFKWMKVNGTALRLMVIGNFDVVPQTGTITFQNAGTWYSHLTGTTRTATGGPETITLQPGEYYVYTSVNVPLPVNGLTFTGARNANGANLVWTIANEVNVKSFELQRSVNGRDFMTIATKTATANNTAQPQSYQYTDKENVVVNGKTVLYYRLKTNDTDGKAGFSKVVLISSKKNELAALLYPNPVSNGTLMVQLAGGVQGKTELQVQDISGRVLSRQSVNAGVTSTTIPVNVTTIATGIYRLKIINGATVTIMPFSVQHP